MPTRFITLFEGRTGSSYFMECLNSLPHVEALSEVIIRMEAAAQRSFIDDFYRQPRAAHIQAIGFKAKLRDVQDQSTFTAQLDAHDVRIIHMIRTNKVKLALSRLNGKRLRAETGLWNRVAGSPPLGPFAPTIEDFDKALRFRMQKEETLNAYVTSLRRPVLTISYEALLADREGVFARTFDFIGAAPGPVHSNTVKNTDDDMRKVLLNYDEIRAHYAGSEFEAMFD